MKKFKKGQWIITQWKDSEDIDFAQFREDLYRNDFMAIQFFRIHKDGKITNLTKFEEPMFYRDHRVKYSFRLATLSEIRKYKKIVRNKRIKIIE